MDPREAESHLESLEPFGWKLGLERMRALSTLLGMPQHRFASIHVVGTNGKSSVTRMAAALLAAHGLRAGAYLSPHAVRWSERVLVGGEEVAPERFAAALARAAETAEIVARGLEPGEMVTQFELATAAAFLALAEARVEVAVVEAGLGGRLDATNTIPSRVTVLSSIGLDHTRWLGESEEEIAAEKLAVLRDHTTLVRGRVSPAVAALAERTAEERGAELIVAPEDPGPEVELRIPGQFQRRNFALAMAAARAFLGELDSAKVAAVAASVEVPGRLQRIDADPPAFADAAHNPQGAAALAEALPTLAGNRPVVACMAMLGDKDAAATVAALAPALERAVCTELPPAVLAVRGMPGSGPHAAADLATACGAAGLTAEAEPDFGAAVRRARELALEVGGPLLVTGSHYALAPAREALGVWED